MLIPPAAVTPEVLGGVLANGVFQIAIKAVEDGFDVLVLVSASRELDKGRERDLELHGAGAVAGGETKRGSRDQMQHGGCLKGSGWVTEEVDHHSVVASVLVEEQGKDLVVV